MDEVEVATVLIRMANAIAWSWLFVRVVRKGKPFSMFARVLASTVVVVGMWVFVVGGFTAFGIPGAVARLTYNAFASYALIVAIAMLTTDEPNNGETVKRRGLRRMRWRAKRHERIRRRREPPTS